ncbi:uncharacterized protein LOC111993000 [Quercus suber]|uniref:uncharacterized protein LOC111993000 n=1 Tax=Quercus suber TaxID=58331 RepID=UPI000CE24F41|nr:uncharacterized protein LOC111993000 [Quercus suber]POE75403.1 hypothetical protein CFP56_53014 [Quercus suber]
MASVVPHSVADDRDLDDADLWAVIDSAVASHSASKSHKSLAIRSPNFQSLPPISNPSPPSKLSKYPKTPNSNHSDAKSRVLAQGEVIQEPWVYRPPRKVARTCASEASETSPLIVLKNLQRTPTTPVYSSPEAHLSPEIGMFSVKELSPHSESYGRSEDKHMVHSLSGRFPSVSLFKEYQNTAMAILERSDYVMISGNPFIKKSGWRKISFYFNLSFEIRDKTIEFDENRNVQRAEFVVRAYMQGGRFSDGWGSCERREKRFLKPNHDIPSTAETRAKNKSCQDLLGIGEYRPGASQGQR